MSDSLNEYENLLHQEKEKLAKREKRVKELEAKVEELNKNVTHRARLASNAIAKK